MFDLTVRGLLPLWPVSGFFSTRLNCGNIMNVPCLCGCTKPQALLVQMMTRQRTAQSGHRLDQGEQWEQSQCPPQDIYLKYWSGKPTLERSGKIWPYKPHCPRSIFIHDNHQNNKPHLTYHHLSQQSPPEWLTPEYKKQTIIKSINEKHKPHCICTKVRTATKCVVHCQTTVCMYDGRERKVHSKYEQNNNNNKSYSLPTIDKHKHKQKHKPHCIMHLTTTRNKSSPSAIITTSAIIKSTASAANTKLQSCNYAMHVPSPESIVVYTKNQ